MIRLFFALILTTCLLVACTSDPLPDDGPAPAVSEQSAMSFLEKTLAAGGATTTGATSLTLTEEEVTSVLEFAATAPNKLIDIEAQLRQEMPEMQTMPQLTFAFPIKEPAVYFKADGTMVLRGRIEFQDQVQPFRFVAKPHGVSGTLELDFVEGRIGSLPMPEAIFDQIGGGLASLILAGQQWAEITDLRVEAGTFTIAGQRSEAPTN